MLYAYAECLLGYIANPFSHLQMPAEYTVLSSTSPEILSHSVGEKLDKILSSKNTEICAYTIYHKQDTEHLTYLCTTNITA